MLENGEFLSDRYVVHFRVGEIYHARGETEKALEKFDECVRILENNKGAPALEVISSPKNSFSIHFKLAHIYWTFGSEYYTYSLKHIEDALLVFNAHEKAITEEEPSVSLSILNNICWYNLFAFNAIVKDRKIDKLDEIDREKAMEFLDKGEEALRNMLMQEGIPLQGYDTAAWFLFCQYKSGVKDKSALTEAKEHLDKVWEADNPKEEDILYSLDSIELRKNHLREIIHALS